MKRIVPFFDIFDEIPDDATHLFSRKVEIVQNVSQDTTAIPGTDLNALYVHYYEVNNIDFETLMDTEVGKKNISDRIKEFAQQHKISLK